MMEGIIGRQGNPPPRGTVAGLLRTRKGVAFLGVATFFLLLVGYSHRPSQSAVLSVSTIVASSPKASLGTAQEYNAPQPPHNLVAPYFALGQDKIDLLKRYQPHSFPNKHGLTFATLLCTRGDTVDDIYFLATRALVYRFLWHSGTKSPDKPMTVFVAPFIPQWQRDVLSAEGAHVIELPLIEITPKQTNYNSDRWRDQYTKLNMWNHTEFSRIAYFDADAFPMHAVDELFQVTQTWRCKEELLEGPDREDIDGICDYTFAGVPIIPWPAIGVNGGLLVFSPNLRMHERLIRMAPETDSYNSEFMEQGMFEWVFSYLGAFPAHQLERKWNGLFPKGEEEGSLNVVHQKVWNKDYNVEGLGWMTEAWDKSWESMSEFYQSERFVRARKSDGLRLLDVAL